MAGTLTPTRGAAQTLPESARKVPGRKTRGYVSLAEHLLLAGLAYIPLLVVKSGTETSDTKTYLYLDPGRFLHQVASMWDPSVGLGTVTHEYIGYLLPMGPFYWLFSALGVPVWVAQRLWLGSILFAAGAGVLFLSRTLNLRAPGRTVAALAFMLSPYFLQYAGRISVILLPWAGLPFMVGLAARALRAAGWRHPALFALTVAITSGINASSIIYVGIAPVLWILYATAVTHETSWRRAGATVLRTAVLTALCCVWWIAGLVVEAGYGVDVLRYTETIPSTSETSTAAEVVRGLGYWYFYGGDRLGPWTQSAVLYTQQVWLLALSYLVPLTAVVGSLFVRWKVRAYFVLLVLVGVVLSVGAHPYSDPTPFGGVLKSFMSHTTAGLALRSTDRATPLVVLGFAMLLGSAVTALRLRTALAGAAAALAASGIVVADNPALFNGDAAVVSFFTQPAKLPSYERTAIDHLNSTHHGTRVLAVPGDAFSAFRWGDTVDSPQPASLDRPFVIREQQVMGSISTADTLYAMDEPIQLGTEQWASLAPMARLMSAGDVLVEYDQAYEHYDAPQPQILATQLQQTPKGLADPVAFGTPRANTPSYATTNGQDLSTPAPVPVSPPLVDYTVEDPRPITRAESDQGALIVDGDASGLEQMAGLGLLDTSSGVYFAGTLDKSRSQLAQLLKSGASLVLTDTNRKQAFRWDTLTADSGETETPSQNPQASDPSDSPIDLFPGAPADSKSTASYSGVETVTASSYGNAVSYTPEDRPYNAIDGNLDTSWETGALQSDPAGQWWETSFDKPVNAGSITLVQARGGSPERWITRVTLTFDGKHPVEAELGASSRTPAGQTVNFAARSFRTLRVRIDATTDDHMPPSSATAVGFAEVGVAGQRATEVIRMPSDLLESAGPFSIGNRFTISMSRERVSAYSDPVRLDPETTISREFYLPTPRTFTISGSASISALIPDDEIDALVGRSGTGPGGVVAYSKGRLPGDLWAGASAAADGDPHTVWQPGFGSASQTGDWLEYDLPHPVTFDHLDMQVVADGLHSVPTSLVISTENGSRPVSLPPIRDGRTPGSTTSVHVAFPSITGSHVRVTITAVRAERTTNYYATAPVDLPLGIAEVGIPGVKVGSVPPNLPGPCVSNLITIDGNPVSVRIVGPTTTALDDEEVSLQPCGEDAGGISLGAGDHLVETALGHSTSTGWNIDQLTLDSAAGGGPEPSAQFDALPSAQPGPAPSVRTDREDTTGMQLTVHDVKSPFELVLGQSSNPGWNAVVSYRAPRSSTTKSIRLGGSQLVDGFANGWQVSARDLRAMGVRTRDVSGSDGTSRSEGKGATLEVQLRWTPQREVFVALAVSAAGILFCLILALYPTVRRRRHTGRTVLPDDQGHRSRPVQGQALEEPVLSNPLVHRGSRPRPVTVVVASVLSGALAAAVTTPLAGVVVAPMVASALLFGALRGPVSLAAVGLFVAAAVSVVFGQALHVVPESSNWPSAYETAGTLAWFAVVALAADAVVGMLRRRDRRGSTEEIRR